MSESSDDPFTAEEIIDNLDLSPHADGGHLRETFRDPREIDGRPLATTSYVLLAAGEEAVWKAAETEELWQFYLGAPLEMEIVFDDVRQVVRVGPDHQPQAFVPQGAWRTARSLGDWTLINRATAPSQTFAVPEPTTKRRPARQETTRQAAMRKSSAASSKARASSHRKSSSE